MGISLNVDIPLTTYKELEEILKEKHFDFKEGFLVAIKEYVNREKERKKRLESYSDIFGMLEDVPDLARNHDKYLYGKEA